MASSNPSGAPLKNDHTLPFIELIRVDSTNNYAMGLVREAMAQHGTAVFAHEQTKGRGQRSKEWFSHANQNIALSLILDASVLSLDYTFQFSMAMALGTYRFLVDLTGSDCTIKWPNDIYWRDRKAAGILIENVWQGGNWKYAVVGVGVNVNQTDFGILSNRAVSIKQITGKEFSPLELAYQLHERLMDAWHQLLKDPHEIAAPYRSKLFRLNQSVMLRKGENVFHATLRGVNDQGQLIVQTNKEECFDVGEVEFSFD